MGTAGSGPPALVSLADGRTIALRGKIDRVDRTPDGSRLLVFDYKSGSAGYYFGLDKDPVKRGKLLQLPIYALAARQSYGDALAVEAYYWFVGEDQGYERRGYDVDDADPRRVPAGAGRDPRWDIVRALPRPAGKGRCATPTRTATSVPTTASAPATAAACGSANGARPNSSDT